MSKIYTLIKPADSPVNSWEETVSVCDELTGENRNKTERDRVLTSASHWRTNISFVGFHTLISIKFFPARAQVLVLDQVDRLTRGINILHALGWRSDWKGDAEAQGINPWATEVIKVRHYEHGQVQYPNYRGSICVTERPYNEEPWRCRDALTYKCCSAELQDTCLFGTD